MDFDLKNAINYPYCIDDNDIKGVPNRILFDSNFYVIKYSLLRLTILLI